MWVAAEWNAGSNETRLPHRMKDKTDLHFLSILFSVHDLGFLLDSKCHVRTKKCGVFGESEIDNLEAASWIEKKPTEPIMWDSSMSCTHAAYLKLCHAPTLDEILDSVTPHFMPSRSVHGEGRFLESFQRDVQTATSVPFVKENILVRHSVHYK